MAVGHLWWGVWVWVVVGAYKVSSLQGGNLNRKNDRLQSPEPQATVDRLSWHHYLSQACPVNQKLRERGCPKNRRSALWEMDQPCDHVACWFWAVFSAPGSCLLWTFSLPNLTHKKASISWNTPTSDVLNWIIEGHMSINLPPQMCIISISRKQRGGEGKMWGQNRDWCQVCIKPPREYLTRLKISHRQEVKRCPSLFFIKDPKPSPLSFSGLSSILVIRAAEAHVTCSPMFTCS